MGFSPSIFAALLKGGKVLIDWEKIIINITGNCWNQQIFRGTKPGTGNTQKPTLLLFQLSFPAKNNLPGSVTDSNLTVQYCNFNGKKRSSISDSKLVVFSRSLMLTLVIESCIVKTRGFRKRKD